MQFVGIDVGTSALKAVLVECDRTVRVVRSAARPYTPDGKPLRNPEVWARLAREAVAEVAAGEVQPAAISFTGQMHSLIAVDAEDRVIDPVLLWLDADGAGDVDRFATEHHLDMVRRTGKPPCADFTLAKWLYARRTHEGYAERARSLWCAKDFVRHRLDPGAAHAIDANEATGMQVYDMFGHAWLPDIAAYAGMALDALPQVSPATAQVGDAGALDPHWAGVPLILGVGDQAAAARAVGSYRAGVASLSLGTSGGLSVPAQMDALPADWTGGFHIFPNGFDDALQIIGSVPVVGGVFTWLAELPGLTLDQIDVLAAASRPGGAACHFFPYLGGAGAPHLNHRIRAELSGIGLGLGRQELVRAVYDGLAMEFRAILDEVRAMGVTVDEVLISGGPARLAALRETLAAFLAADCYAVEGHDASAIGTALLGADHVVPDQHLTLPRQPITPAHSCDPPPEWRTRRYAMLGIRQT